MKLTRYELRLYDNGIPFAHLLSYVPFETEQQAINYWNENKEEMCDDWCLYLVTLTPNDDHAKFIRRMK